MQEQHPNTGSSALTQHKAPWSDDEVTLLRTFAAVEAHNADLRAAFPGRTLGAIRVKLTHERRRMGIEPKQGKIVKRTYCTPMLEPDEPGEPCNYPDRWRKRAAEANAVFLFAMQQASA